MLNSDMIFRAVLTALLLAAANARAVILLGDGGSTANTTAPTGELTGSGWQFEGTFGVYLGTPIAPSFFITAKHLGSADSVFRFNGSTYSLVRQYNDALSDLSIWQISGTFSAVGPLYTSGMETGQRLVVFGRGTQRGSAIFLNGTLRGWNWGGSDFVQRWGENYVRAIVHVGPANAYVYATFDQGGAPNESHLSSGDSGGAVFIQDAGVWKLAGINYAVDDLYTDALGNGGFNAAIFDARDYYTQDSTNPPHFTLITGARPQPTGYYATQISSKLGWIYSVVDPAGDANGNGLSNRLDYARDLNSPEPAGPGATPVSIENGFFTLTYRKLTTPNNLQYVIKKSPDLVNWSVATAQETILSSGDDVQTVKAKVAISGTGMFLRLEISETTALNYRRPRLL